MKYDEKSQKLVVRSGIRTHAHRSGLRPERSALDLSAILTAWIQIENYTINHRNSGCATWPSLVSLLNSGPLAQLVRASC